MGYSAKAVANYLLGLGDRDGVPLTPMSLQKLVYISHGWHLALRGEALVTDEHPEAWDYGPVFPSLFYEFREFGSKPVTRSAGDVVLFDDGQWAEHASTISQTDVVTRDLVERVWSQYNHLSGLQLSDLTHQNGSPWYQTRLTASGFRNTPISRDLIEEHFRDLAWKNREHRTREVA